MRKVEDYMTFDEIQKGVEKIISEHWSLQENYKTEVRTYRKMTHLVVWESLTNCEIMSENVFRWLWPVLNRSSWYVTTNDKGGVELVIYTPRIII